MLEIHGFLESLSREDENDKMNNGNGSRRNKISALKSFFNYCKIIDLIQHNIILDIDKQPKIPIRLPKFFTIEECKHLIECVGKRNAVRDKMIIILFLSTGLRLTELIKLDIRCIKNENLTIIGKGNKERNVYLSSGLISSLEKYIEQRPVTKETALFLSERGGRISKSAVQNILKNTIKRAGLKAEGETDVLVHILRHSFATNEYQSGTDIIMLQDLLGHADISTTKRYVSVSKKQMKEHANNSVMNSII